MSGEINSPSNSSIETIINELVSRIENLEQIAQRQQETIDQQSERIEQLESNQDELKETVTEQSQTIAEQSDRIEELEQIEENSASVKWDSSNHKDAEIISTEGASYPIGRSISSKVSQTELDEVESQLDEIENSDSTDASPTTQTEEDVFHKPETSLEDVIRVPEHLVEDSLSANQQRARFVAKDIHQYSRKVPAGRALKSSQLRKVLAARKEGRVHTETVSRVIDYLDDLGEDSVSVEETQSGERTVIFTDEVVTRIVAYENQNTNHSVVAPKRVEGSREA